MGAWAVPACIGASSEAILAVTGFPRIRGFRGVRASSEIDAAGGRATEGRPSRDHSCPQESPSWIQGRKFHDALELSGSNERSLPSNREQSLRIDAINLVDILPQTTNHFRSTPKESGTSASNNRVVGETTSTGTPIRSAPAFPLSPHAASGYAEPHGRRMGTRVE